MIRTFRSFTTPAAIATIAVAWAVSANIAVCQDGRILSAETSDNSNRKPAPPQDHKPLQGQWEKVVFGGEGAVHISKTDEGGEVIDMLAGDPITGIRWSGKFPKENYELKLQARRLEGFDFFAAVTFPVGKEHCSFVLGGWGGGLVGISSIDGNDASTNETTKYKEFETNKWYTIRIRVDDKTVRCWIDEDEYAAIPRGENELSIRLEMDPCLPMGIANYMTRSELKDISLGRIGDAAKEAPVKSEDAAVKDATTAAEDRKSPAAEGGK